MNTATFTFHSLTPDLILNGLDDIGLHVDSGLTVLNSYENRVYQFADDNKQRYVVKFYRPLRWTQAQILEEHQFIAELALAEIPAVAPLLINGSTLHEYQGYWFAVFTSVGGRQYEVDNLDQLEGVGRFLGRIHQIGQAQTFQCRPNVGLNEYVYQPIEILLSSALIPQKIRADFGVALKQLATTIAQHWHTNWPMIRLHGDCHPGNILWRDGPLFVDFDDARNGPAVQDLWMLLQGERQEQLIQLDILLEAYQEFADFDRSQLALIEPLRAMRMIHYLAWIINRWQDPAFPKNFPWIVDSDFWYQQLALFKQQIIAIQAPPLTLLAPF